MMRTSWPAYSERPETWPLGLTFFVPRILPSEPMSIFMPILSVGPQAPHVARVDGASRRCRASCVHLWSGVDGPPGYEVLPAAAAQADALRNGDGAGSARPGVAPPQRTFRLGGCTVTLVGTIAGYRPDGARVTAAI